MLMICICASAEEELKLLGYDQMIKEIDSVVVTDKLHYTERKKSGAPKYLHQLKEEFYYMQVTPSSHYTLVLSPVEWFDIERIEKDKFKVRIIEPMDIYYKYKSKEFSIGWRVDESVYCDECNYSRFNNKFRSELGLRKKAPPFKLLGFEQMLREFYGAIDTGDIKFETKQGSEELKYLHQIEDEVYTLVVSEPGNYSLKLSPESWFKIEQTQGHVFQVRFVDPVNSRQQKYDDDFTVDWQLDEVNY